MLAWLQDFWTTFYQPWTVYQLVTIIAIYAAAKLLAYKVEPRCEAWVRRIKGRPRLMRFLVPLLRNTDWILFFLLLCMLYNVMQQTTWPSRSYFLGIAMRLSFAWIAILVISRVIRNRSLARMVALVCWVFVALLMLDLLDNTAQALDAMAFSMGDFRLSALQLLQGLALVFCLLWAASAVGRFFDRQIGSFDDLTPSLKVLIGKIVRIFLFVAAVAIAASSVGIDLTALTIFSGAVGVGIGFGLQRVVSNFISGIIILLDKSIKPGDTITLGETFGWIRELRARFVSVVTRDGKEFLIPNEDFITQQVVNWSFTDNLIRLDVPFGVSYDCNPHTVSALAIEACESVERISSSKPPVCWMTGFGDSSLNFLLRFWIEDPQNGVTNIRGKVLFALWDAFEANKIEIPYPHREIIFKNPPLSGSDNAAIDAGNSADCAGLSRAS